VSLTIPPGRSVAIVGKSGSGKSTVLRLVTRLYDATGGSLLVNGQDIKDVTLDSLRQAVAVVPQDCALQHDSILENIRWVWAAGWGLPGGGAGAGGGLHVAVLGGRW
jgi:ABC-type multidrug transport system fused ATPase/permease subunit